MTSASIGTANAAASFYENVLFAVGARSIGTSGAGPEATLSVGAAPEDKAVLSAMFKPRLGETTPVVVEEVRYGKAGVGDDRPVEQQASERIANIPHVEAVWFEENGAKLLVATASRQAAEGLGFLLADQIGKAKVEITGQGDSPGFKDWGWRLIDTNDTSIRSFPPS